MITRLPRAAAVVALAALAACTSTPGARPDGSATTSEPRATERTPPTNADSVPPTAPDVPVGQIEWTRLDAELDEGRLEVPLDWDDPDNGATVELYLVRHRATDPANRIGTLLVNPGGPGAGGADLAEFATGIYTAELVDRFDIVGWDPRGTGASSPAVECGDDYDTWFGLDAGPDDDAERQALEDAARQLVAGCVAESEGILPFVDTVSSARDMDAIRRALDEDTVSYFGFSYGSELGAVWATLFPDTVRAAVLDGASDLSVPYFEQNVQQAVGFETGLQTLLDRCSADRTCPFHNDGRAAEAFDELAARIETDPIGGGRTPVTEGVLMTAVVASLYDERSWGRLEQALADAQTGDGAGLVDLYDEYYDIGPGGRPQSNVIEAYFAIGCLDDPGTSGPDELFERAGELAAAAPRVGPSYQLELMVCAVWPGGERSTDTYDAAGAGPILVVGTTGDTATPFTSTQALAASLEDGRLLTVEADQHTGYGVNTCVDTAIDSYLIDPTDLPAEGARC